MALMLTLASESLQTPPSPKRTACDTQAWAVVDAKAHTEALEHAIAADREAAAAAAARACQEDTDQEYATLEHAAADRDATMRTRSEDVKFVHHDGAPPSMMPFTCTRLPSSPTSTPRQSGPKHQDPCALVLIVLETSFDQYTRWHKLFLLAWGSSPMKITFSMIFQTWHSWAGHT